MANSSPPYHIPETPLAFDALAKITLNYVKPDKMDGTIFIILLDDTQRN